ncbi:glycosyltransferase, partial [Alicyclobacillus sp.]|uniref:glycosyltransferase n=1 Tax=Alicyclobacillus sp. TaxID=61169 RepID=UPI0025C34C99
KRPRDPLSRAVAPVDEWTFVFLVPCLNEGAVLRNTLRAIRDLPWRRVWVWVIDDASDDDTLAIVREVAGTDRRVRWIHRRSPHARRGKGDALNAAYRRVDRIATRFGADPASVILTVLDADGRPAPNLLPEAAAVFSDRRVGAAQARVRIANRDGILPLLQDVEFAAAVAAIQNARAFFGSVGLGGNGQFTRLSALRTLGPTPWTRCLLEDFDLGVRLLLAGWHIRFLPGAHVAQQGLVSVRRFIRQRCRWAQGNLQCLRHVRPILASRLGAAAKLDLLYFLAQPWLNALGSIVQAGAWGVIIGTLWRLPRARIGFGAGSPALAMIFWLTLTLLPGIAWAMRYSRLPGEGRPRRLWRVILAIPLYNLLTIPSVWWALARHLRGRGQWSKTERLTERHAGMDMCGEGG